MFKRRLFLTVLSGMLFLFVQHAVAGPELVGAPKCKTCHGAKTGDQWQIWSDSNHARAFETLASAESARIASELGLGNPQEEAACLRCHATLASLGKDVAINDGAKYANDEGVGCEACHGPGSDYKPRKIMLDPKAAREAGLIMNTAKGGCTHCHNDESPTFKGFDFKARWAEIRHPVPHEATAEAAEPASLTKAGSLQEILIESSVGYVIFPHDFHVTDVEMACVECHHQIHAVELDTPHPDYLTSSWINCQACHSPESVASDAYYRCSECHHENPSNIADETLSAKVVVHKNCWQCHETQTGAEASKGCVDCHVKGDW